MILAVIFLSLCKNIGTIFYIAITKSYLTIRNWYHLKILKLNKIKSKCRNYRPQNTNKVSINETQIWDKTTKDSSSNASPTKSTKHIQIYKPSKLNQKQKQAKIVRNCKKIPVSPTNSVNICTYENV